MMYLSLSSHIRSTPKKTFDPAALTHHIRF